MRKLTLLVLFLVVCIPAVSQAQTPVECFCVKYLRVVLGVPVRGDAIDLVPNLEPRKAIVGDVILMQYGKIGHAALITKVTRTGFLIQEANYHTCAVSVREVNYNDENIRGFLRPY